MTSTLPEVAPAQPEWVICGMPHPVDGLVRLVASKELNQAQLQERLLTADMGESGLSIVDATSYAEALAALFRVWAPDGADWQRLAEADWRLKEPLQENS